MAAAAPRRGKSGSRLAELAKGSRDELGGPGNAVHRVRMMNMPAGAMSRDLVLALLHTPPSQHGLNRS